MGPPGYVLNNEMEICFIRLPQTGAFVLEMLSPFRSPWTVTAPKEDRLEKMVNKPGAYFIQIT